MNPNFDSRSPRFEYGRETSAINDNPIGLPADDALRSRRKPDASSERGKVSATADYLKARKAGALNQPGQSIVAVTSPVSPDFSGSRFTAATAYRDDGASFTGDRKAPTDSYSSLSGTSSSRLLPEQWKRNPNVYQPSLAGNLHNGNGSDYVDSGASENGADLSLDRERQFPPQARSSTYCRDQEIHSDYSRTDNYASDFEPKNCNTAASWKQNGTSSLPVSDGVERSQSQGLVQHSSALPERERYLADTYSDEMTAISEKLPTQLPESFESSDILAHSINPQGNAQILKPAANDRPAIKPKPKFPGSVDKRTIAPVNEVASFGNSQDILCKDFQPGIKAASYDSTNLRASALAERSQGRLHNKSTDRDTQDTLMIQNQLPKALNKIDRENLGHCFDSNIVGSSATKSGLSFTSESSRMIPKSATSTPDYALNPLSTGGLSFTTSQVSTAGGNVEFKEGSGAKEGASNFCSTDMKQSSVLAEKSFNETESACLSNMAEQVNGKPSSKNTSVLQSGSNDTPTLPSVPVLSSLSQVSQTLPKRSRIPMSQSQPGSRSTSPSPRFSYMTNNNPEATIPTTPTTSSLKQPRRLPAAPVESSSAATLNSKTAPDRATSHLSQRPTSSTTSRNRSIQSQSSSTSNRPKSAATTSIAIPKRPSSALGVSAPSYNRVSVSSASSNNHYVSATSTPNQSASSGRPKSRIPRSVGHSRETSPNSSLQPDLVGAGRTPISGDHVDSRYKVSGRQSAGGTGTTKQSRIPVGSGRSGEASPGSASASHVVMPVVRKSRIPRSLDHSRDTSPSRSSESSDMRTPSSRGVPRSGGVLGATVGVGLLSSHLLLAGPDMEAAFSDALISSRRDLEARSETSSVSSGSYTRAPVNLSVEQAHSSMCTFSHYIFSDVSDVIRRLSSQSWLERRDGLSALQDFLHANGTLTPSELKRVTEIFTRMFHDPSAKVFSSFLDALPDVLVAHAANAPDWLFTCMSRLFLKTGAELLGSVLAKVTTSLDAIRDTYPFDLQFLALAKVMVDPAQTSNMKIRLAILEYIHEMALQMEPGDFLNCDSIRQVSLRVINWTNEPKQPDIRKCARVVVVSFFNLNSPEFTAVLSSLPRGMQDTATKILHDHMFTVSRHNSFSGENTPSSSHSYSGVSHRDTSAEQDENDEEDDDVSAEDFYASLRKTTEDIENLNRSDL